MSWVYICIEEVDIANSTTPCVLLYMAQMYCNPAMLMTFGMALVLEALVYQASNCIFGLYF
jgi:hypothetical protein